MVNAYFRDVDVLVFRESSDVIFKDVVAFTVE